MDRTIDQTNSSDIYSSKSAKNYFVPWKKELIFFSNELPAAGSEIVSQVALAHVLRHQGDARWRTVQHHSQQLH